MSWLDEIKTLSIEAVAALRGITIEHNHGGPCPKCGATRRSRSDRRPPLHFSTKDGRGVWHCHAKGGCGAEGDNADLVAYGLTNERLNGNDRVAEVRSWFEENREAISAKTQELAGSTALQPRKDPPPEGIAEFAGACGPCHEDPDVKGYLGKRGLDAEILGTQFNIGALPLLVTAATTPPWARLGARTWIEAGYRLLVVLFNALGLAASITARRIIDGDGPKVVVPQGYKSSSLVMASPLAVRMLRGEAMPQGIGIAVVEGMTDFATACQAWGDRYPILGIFAGAWTDDIAARIPDGANLNLWTDADEAGDKLAKVVVESVADRCHCWRGRPDDFCPEANDLNALLEFGYMPAEPSIGVKPMQGAAVQGGGGEIVVAPAMEPARRGQQLPATTHSSSIDWLQIRPISFWSKEDGEDWLDVDPPERQYLLVDRYEEGVLPLGKVGLLAGAGGTGKTLLMVATAIAVAAGRTLFGLYGYRVANPGPVALVLAEEETEEVRRRLHANAAALDLNDDEKDLVRQGVFPVPAAGRSVGLSRPGEQDIVESAFCAALKQRLVEAAPPEGWRLVILDPLSRFAGLDVEVDNAAATRFIQIAETFLDLPGNPTVLVAHHTTKEARKGPSRGSTAVRGSSALVDGARWVAELTPEEMTDDQFQFASLVWFRVSKSNYTASGTPLLLKHALGAGGTLVAASKEEFRRLMAAKKAKKKGKGKDSDGAKGNSGGEGGDAHDDLGPLGEHGM